MTDFPTHIVPIQLGERSYEIHIGSGLIAQANTFQHLPKASSVMVVSNTTVSPLYASQLLTALAHRYAAVHQIVLPDGESYKNWETLNLVFSALLERGCDRKTLVIALGGGVVGDMAGFAAACFMRGVPFVQIPTTLLSQVDSSVGGKTGVNHPLGKNMVGAFYQPLQVVCDIDTLKTLPYREISAGLAEIIKYGPIADMEFFAWLEVNIDLLMRRDPVAMTHAIRRSCEIKAHVVGQDEREGGLRAILNFGHTFGHAIETGMGYGAWLHGEAVGCGMVMAAQLSLRLGLVDASFVQRLRALVVRAGLPATGPVLDAQDNAGRYLALMRHDKKSVSGEIRFVVISGPSKASMQAAPEAMVRSVIDSCCA